MQRHNVRRARQLRRDMTKAEHVLWRRLSGRQFRGLKFVRQLPIGPYIADFCCRQRMIIIEVDGGQHADNLNDVKRTQYLEVLGYRVIRFWNSEVLTNIEGVLDNLHRHLLRPFSVGDNTQDAIDEGALEH